MNKKSNAYTIIYIIVLVVVVGAALALTSMALKDRQQANADADKMRQILASVKVTAPEGQVKETFDKYIVESFVVDAKGKRVQGDAFTINVAEQVKLTDDARRLPVYVYSPEPTSKDKSKYKYILPVYGAGLWGPIWGYIAMESDGSTVYGAYFAHQGETPGLGAEIEKPKFTDQFNPELHMFKNGKFLPIEVVKAGQKPTSDADYVDGVSGGTITSKGVGAMINNCITPYQAFLETLKNN